jgi:hypothetical protein
VVPPVKSVEQLLEEVEQLLAQKVALEKKFRAELAELEKREQEVRQDLRKQLDKLTERLNRVSGNPPPSTSPTPSLPNAPSGGGQPRFRW